jgi:hypothetical protein
MLRSLGKNAGGGMMSPKESQLILQRVGNEKPIVVAASTDLENHEGILFLKGLSKLTYADNLDQPLDRKAIDKYLLQNRPVMKFLQDHAAIDGTMELRTQSVAGQLLTGIVVPHMGAALDMLSDTYSGCSADTERFVFAYSSLENVNLLDVIKTKHELGSSPTMGIA